jgi:DNA-binding NarL/FixJ family response regulator
VNDGHGRAVLLGEAAVELAARTLPSVILMDIHLAGSMSSTEAARQIWEIANPVVYVTAFADDATLDEVKTSEPYGYVVKPFRGQEVDAADPARARPSRQRTASWLKPTYVSA